MIKIFLTSDNHIGLNKGNAELYDNRIDVFESMVNEANTEKCDIFIVAGDLFEDNIGHKKDIKKIFDILSRFNNTVAVLPGNHDYYEKGLEFWNDIEKALEKHKSILLLNEYKEYSVKSINDEDIVLYPALCKSKHSKENALGWIKNKKIVPDEKYRICVAHGSVDGETIDAEGDYYCMTKKELEELSLDAYLIGHTHVPFPNNLKTSFSSVKDKIFNAGTHLQTNVNNNTEGLCFILEIDQDKKIKAKKYVSGNIFYKRVVLNVKPGELKETIQNEVKKYNKKTIIDLVLNGSLLMEEYENREEIINEELSGFMSYTYDSSNLSKSITKKFIESKFPETSFSAKLLKSLLKDPKETQLVYDLLQELKGGK